MLRIFQCKARKTGGSGGHEDGRRREQEEDVDEERKEVKKVKINLKGRLILF